MTATRASSQFCLGRFHVPKAGCEIRSTRRLTHRLIAALASLPSQALTRREAARVAANSLGYWREGMARMVGNQPPTPRVTRPYKRYQAQSPASAVAQAIVGLRGVFTKHQATGFLYSSHF
jgi:hypothetical protein